ncbi:type II toxin-antitoxin system RelE/ParE family toxin [Pasteurellaceae bacterium 20609_3]|uniref:type II toxin-antitoxin system RelE family toxin n=1 Tax=Spirabiliibacterium mucosae TaxID=28156 RepID=UPI001AAC872C|nr:type II toxin-antitoxin system RelE/ParE family toxin [Spirabiliibacterium mucosae]MBE2897472.1 type II toxin-antitoxin system RelE/ParE family toxin [Spirabiliibacterium mucosae]
MSYTIEFIPSAEKEFRKLDLSIRKQFVEKLRQRAENPKVPSARLHGLKDCFKIKLRASGFRLVYQVIDERIVIKVIAVGKRERNLVYRNAKVRL